MTFPLPGQLEGNDHKSNKIKRWSVEEGGTVRRRWTEGRKENKKPPSL
jgi:hypothetical protein